MNRYTIQNRNGVKLVVQAQNTSGKSGLAFVIHGLGGFKEQKHIQAMAEVFIDNDYVVVTYDAANSIGESGGRMEDATLTNYYEDFVDVVEWSREQSFYDEPFIVSGHSLGGACSILYAADFPDRVKAIAPISSFVGGETYRQRLDPEHLKEWQRKGYVLEESKSKPGVMKKIGWSLAEDTMSHDLTKTAGKIDLPTLLVTGSEDTGTPESAQRLVANQIGDSAEVHVINDMGHNPRSDKHLAELKSILDDWLKRLQA